MSSLKIYNKPFELKDMKEIKESKVTQELKELVDEFTRENLATTAMGNLSQTNLTEILKYEFTLNPEKLWSYVRIVEICQIKPKMRVLDGGGGSSPLVFYLGKKGVEIFVLDLQKDLIENTKKIAKKKGWENIKAIQGDIAQIPFPENYFDVVYSISVLQNLPHKVKTKAVKEMARVLKPGGILGLVFDFGKSVKKREKYFSKKYDFFHLPLASAKEIEKYIILPSGLEILGNKELSEKIEVDKNFVRKTYLSNLKRKKNFLKILALPYLFFFSKYFSFTCYSLFLKKPK